MGCQGAAGGGTETTGADRWELQHSRRRETRWRRDHERVACFRFDDGYVGTVSYDDRTTVWQLTPGPVPLGTALVAVALYLQHDVAPQFDRNGRPFIAIDDDGPANVFEEIADRPLTYEYLDGVRTVEEFPAFVAVTKNIECVFERMSPPKTSALGGD